MLHGKCIEHIQSCPELKTCLRLCPVSQKFVYVMTLKRPLKQCLLYVPDIVLLVYKSWKTTDTKTRFFETAKSLNYLEPKVNTQSIITKVAGDNGISEMKSKQQSPYSNCMHQPVMSWDNACSTCMHKPVMSQADACTYCMGSKVSSVSQIYLYTSYFDNHILQINAANYIDLCKQPIEI
jgi:hypothetical protein